MNEKFYTATIWVTGVDRNYTVTGLTKDEIRGYEKAISQGMGVSIHLTQIDELLYFAPGQISHIHAKRTGIR